MWSTNLAVNLPKAARTLLGRRAHDAGAPSVGAMVKDLVGRGLAETDPKAAAEWREIMARYYPNRKQVGSALLLGFFGLFLVYGDDVVRRADRRCQVSGVRYQVKKREEAFV